MATESSIKKMKKKIYCLLLTMISIINLSLTFNNISYQTECASQDVMGFVTLKIWNPVDGSGYKLEQAQKDAIHAILFSGISGSSTCSAQSPILKNQEEKENFKNIEKEFFSKKGSWILFTKGSTIASTLPVSFGEKNWKIYQIGVAKKELRKYLEDQKIIKSLTNGF